MGIGRRVDETSGEEATRLMAATGRGGSAGRFIEVLSCALRGGGQNCHRRLQAGTKDVVRIGDFRPDAGLKTGTVGDHIDKADLAVERLLFDIQVDFGNAQTDGDGRADLHVPDIPFVHFSFDPNHVRVDDLEDRVALVDRLAAVLLDARHDSVKRGQ